MHGVMVQHSWGIATSMSMSVDFPFDSEHMNTLPH